MLKGWEADLQAALISAHANGAIEGMKYMATVAEHERRVFHSTCLPAYIRDDPAFYRLSRSHVVEVKRAARPVRLSPAQEDDFEVIERESPAFSRLGDPVSITAGQADADHPIRTGSSAGPSAVLRQVHR